MGTRGLIYFSEQDVKEDEFNEFVENNISIYKHWDSYPTNVLSLISKYIKYCDGNDVGYGLATFVHCLKTDDAMSHLHRDNEFFNGLSYGIQIGNNMGEEWIYIICPTIIVVYNVWSERYMTIPRSEIFKDEPFFRFNVEQVMKDNNLF